MHARDSEKPGQNPFRVLSLDGGGMRGLYTATVLDTLVERFGGGVERDIGKGFNLITGTSTGGILACALAYGLPAKRIIELFKNVGPQIFTDPTPSGKVALSAWIFRNLKRSANTNSHLKDALTECFGTKTVGDLYHERGIGLCVPAVNLATSKPRVFKTGHDPKKNLDDQLSLVDLCLATSAAPIVLPLAEVCDPFDPEVCHVFADGGLWANNPVLVGLVEALTLTTPTTPIEVLSIGTCPPPSGALVMKGKTKWGLYKWKAGIWSLSLSLDAQSAGHHFIATILAQQLSQCGRSCTIMRLPQGAPSNEQTVHLGLDRASPESIQVLMQLARTDGNMIHGAALRGENGLLLVKDIFEQLVPLPLS